jgi:hypothetical protein
MIDSDDDDDMYGCVDDIRQRDPAIDADLPFPDTRHRRVQAVRGTELCKETEVHGYSEKGSFQRDDLHFFRKETPHDAKDHPCRNKRNKIVKPSPKQWSSDDKINTKSKVVPYQPDE